MILKGGRSISSAGGGAGGYESGVMLITTMTTAPLQKERAGESSLAILDTGGEQPAAGLCWNRERERGLSPGLPDLCNKDILEGSLSEEAMEAERSKTIVIKLTVALSIDRFVQSSDGFNDKLFRKFSLMQWQPN